LVSTSLAAKTSVASNKVQVVCEAEGLRHRNLYNGIRPSFTLAECLNHAHHRAFVDINGIVQL
jgi:hypothetical protein